MCECLIMKYKNAKSNSHTNLTMSSLRLANVKEMSPIEWKPKVSVSTLSGVVTIETQPSCLCNQGHEVFEVMFTMLNI